MESDLGERSLEPTIGEPSIDDKTANKNKREADGPNDTREDK